MKLKELMNFRFHTGWRVYIINYLKKGVIIFIFLMYLGITNINVHSSIGSYQILSQAIKANNTYYAHNQKEYFNYLTMVTAVVSPVVGAVAIAIMVAKVAALLTTPAVMAGLGFSSPKYGQSLIIERYNKYDFSKFDN